MSKTAAEIDRILGSGVLTPLNRDVDIDPNYDPTVDRLLRAIAKRDITAQQLALEKVKATDPVLYKSVLGGLTTASMEQRRAQMRDEMWFARVDAAQAMLDKTGLTPDRKSAYAPLKSEIAYKNITPFGYSGHIEEMLKAMDEYKRGVMPDLKNFKRNYAGTVDEPLGKAALERREDAWRMYLGLPQLNKTFSVSQFRPANDRSRQPYLRLNNFLENQFKDPDAILGSLITATIAAQTLKQKHIKHDYNGVMGQYKMSIGRDKYGDYLSYYDIWDLDIPEAGKAVAGGLGKPFEIYDRIYFDPKTNKRIIVDPRKKK